MYLSYWSPEWDSNPHCTRFKLATSAWLGYREIVDHLRRSFHPRISFSYLIAKNIRTRTFTVKESLSFQRVNQHSPSTNYSIFLLIHLFFKIVTLINWFQTLFSELGSGMANVDVELVEFYNVSFIDSQRSTTLSPLRSTKWTTINEAFNVQITLKKRTS